MINDHLKKKVIKIQMRLPEAVETDWSDSDDAILLDTKRRATASCNEQEESVIIYWLIKKYFSLFSLADTGYKFSFNSN